MHGTHTPGTRGALALLVLTTLAGLGWPAPPSAALLLFTDKQAFLTQTGATSATGPLPNLGRILDNAETVGSITFSTPAGSDLHIGALNNQTVPSGDWTPACGINGAVGHGAGEVGDVMCPLARDRGIVCITWVVPND